MGFDWDKAVLAGVVPAVDNVFGVFLPLEELVDNLGTVLAVGEVVTELVI